MAIPAVIGAPRFDPAPVNQATKLVRPLEETRSSMVVIEDAIR
jgi:hypothetical protein